MTVQGSPVGPGTEQYRSSFFAATLNGVAQYIYAHSRAAVFDTLWWNQGDPVEVSMLKFGADETTTVVVSRVDAQPISSYEITPSTVNLNPSLSGGNLTLTVPAGTNAEVRVDGDSTNILCIFARGLKSSVPAGTTDWTSLAKPISSVNTGTNEITFTSPHGLTSGQNIVFPVPSGGSLPGGINEAEPYTVTVVSPTVVTLSTYLGAAVDITSAGSGSLVAYPNFYTNASSPLYFGPGRHVIGWSFDPANGVTMYADRDAVVVGGVQLTNIDTVTWRGPGWIDQTFETYEDLLAISEDNRKRRSAFYGFGDTDTHFNNTVNEVTIFGCPFWATTIGVATFDDVQIVSPWTPNTDGFIPARRYSGSVSVASITNCYAFVGDDAIHAHSWGKQLTVANCRILSSASACLHFGYEPLGTLNPNQFTNITNVVCTNLELGQDPNDQFCQIIKCWLDGSNTQSANGTFNVTIDGLTVDGEFRGQLWSLRNYSATWDTNPLNQAGQIAYWTIRNLTATNTPAKLSIINGSNSVSTPHNITFEDITIGGVAVNESNYLDFTSVNEFPYNIFWDAVVLPDPGPGPFGPEFTSTFLSELEAVNTMLTAIGSAPVSSLTGVQSPDVAVARHILTEVRRDVLLQGWTFNTEYEYPLTPGADGRIRVPLGTLRIDVDPYRFQEIDPVQRGLYLYDRKSHSYTFSSPIKVELIMDLPWDQLPEVARNYIAARAATIFIGRMDAGNDRIQAAQQIEMMALVTMKQNETDTGDYTMLGGRTGYEILYRGR